MFIVMLANEKKRIVIGRKGKRKVIYGEMMI